MNPQQQYGFTPVNQQSPDDQKTKLMFFGLGALLLVSVILVVAMLSNRNPSSSLFIESIGYHREQLRLSELAEEYAQEDLELVNYQADLRALVASDLSSLQTAYGSEIDDKQITSVIDENAETRFSEAAQTNTFADEYKETIGSSIDKTVQSLTKLKGLVKKDHATIDTAIENQKALFDQLDKI